MLRKTIMFKDLDGNALVEDFYFHISKTELIKLEISQDEGMEAYLKKIVASGNNKEIMAIFESIILSSYGRRSDDGKRFIKSAEISEEFHQTDAYEELMFELMTDAGAAAKFITGCLPDDFESRIKELEVATENVELPADAVRKVTDYTEAELLSMDQDEFDKVAGTDPQKMSREVMLIAFRRRTRTDPVQQ